MIKKVEKKDSGSFVSASAVMLPIVAASVLLAVYFRIAGYDKIVVFCPLVFAIIISVSMFLWYLSSFITLCQEGR